MLSMAGCGKDSYPSVSSVSEEWLTVKTNLMDSSAPENLQIQIEEFQLTLNRFFDSPVGSLYRIRRPGEMKSITGVVTEIDLLKIAVLEQPDFSPQFADASIGCEVFPIILEIDSRLETLRRIDASLSNTSQLHYFQLFFFFSLLVIVIILTLRVLYTRLEKAENREQQSRIFSRETMMAQEQERSRIARELHDTVAQDLWRLSFQTDIIDKTADAAERSRLCAAVVIEQKELMRRIRNICDNLVPPDFQHRLLGDALRNLCYQFEQRTSIELQLTIQGDGTGGSGIESLGSDVQLQCFRIVQECLANIEKHSEATEVSVIVRRKDANLSPANFSSSELLMCVSDNGKGFPAPDSSAMDADYFMRLRDEGHFGLWNIYERASLLGGTLTLDSETGEGTTITLRIPLLTTRGGQ
ncbi:MAG: sensor histidine kinase [Treponema sp.]|jgi:signal transduction histidine kinase|nr:sensor histidine kinase [Treponema sp.]